MKSRSKGVAWQQRGSLLRLLDLIRDPPKGWTGLVAAVFHEPAAAAPECLVRDQPAVIKGIWMRDFGDYLGNICVETAECHRLCVPSSASTFNLESGLSESASTRGFCHRNGSCVRGIILI